MGVREEKKANAKHVDHQKFLVIIIIILKVLYKKF
jgi:hypothetical protein